MMPIMVLASDIWRDNGRALNEATCSWKSRRRRICQYCRRRRRRSVYMKRSIFHVTGPWRGSLGATFVPVDWQVRMFGQSGLIYRPSGHIYVRTIPLSGCVDRRSCYRSNLIIFWNCFYQQIMDAVYMSFFLTSASFLIPISTALIIPETWDLSLAQWWNSVISKNRPPHGIIVFSGGHLAEFSSIFPVFDAVLYLNTFYGGDKLTPLSPFYALKEILFPVFLFHIYLERAKGSYCSLSNNYSHL